jgi:hypothetical protein
VRDWEQAYNNSAPFFDHVKRVYAGKKAYVLSGTYYELCYRGNVDILYWSSNMMPGIVPYGELDELFHRWPFPREGNGYQRVLKRYGVELVMCHEATAEFLGPSTLVGLEAIEMPPSQYRLFRLN